MLTRKNDFGEEFQRSNEEKDVLEHFLDIVYVVKLILEIPPCEHSTLKRKYVLVELFPTRPHPISSAAKLFR